MSQGSCDCEGFTCFCQPACGTNSLGERGIILNEESALCVPSTKAPVQRLLSLDTPFPGDKPSQLVVSDAASTANKKFMLNLGTDRGEADTETNPISPFSEKGAASRALKSFQELGEWKNSHSLMITSPPLLLTVDPKGNSNHMEKMSSNFARNRTFVNKEELNFLANSVTAQDVKGRQARLYLDLCEEHIP